MFYCIKETKRKSSKRSLSDDVVVVVIRKEVNEFPIHSRTVVTVWLLAVNGQSLILRRRLVRRIGCQSL